MAERDGWEKAESMCKSTAALLVPIILGIAGFFANGHLESQKQVVEREKLSQQMLNKAIEVVFFAKEKEQLFGAETSLEGRHLYRAHWLETYNQFAQVKLSDAFMAAVMDQDTGTAAYPIVRALEKENSKFGDGWVAVGRFPAEQTSYQNFRVLDGSVKKNGEIEVGTMLRARWTVNLRKNYENPSEGAINPVLGTIQAGECVKVLESRADVRGQTWAYIDVTPCSGGASNARVAARAPSKDDHRSD
jgi:hypothetical protein